MDNIVVTGVESSSAIEVSAVAVDQQILVSGTVAVKGDPGPRGPQGIQGPPGDAASVTLAWGNFVGNINDQADLQTALNTKLSKTSNLSDVSNPSQARTNLGLGIGTNVEAYQAPATSSDYLRGDKTFQNLNAAVRLNRLDQMAVPTASVNMASQKLTGVATPTSPTDATNKQYVDQVAQGLSVKLSVTAATAAALPTNTYLSNVITASANGALTLDGVTPATSDRVLIKNEVTASKNGIYTVTDTGDASHPFILTRATDMDANNEVSGAFTFVISGTINANAGYIVSSPGPFTLGTTAINWTQFSSSSLPDASTTVKGKALLGAAGGAATFESTAEYATHDHTFTGLIQFVQGIVMPDSASNLWLVTPNTDGSLQTTPYYDGSYGYSFITEDGANVYLSEDSLTYLAQEA